MTTSLRTSAILETMENIRDIRDGGTRGGGPAFMGSEGVKWEGWKSGMTYVNVGVGVEIVSILYCT